MRLVWFRRFAGVVLGLLGALLLINGAVWLFSHRWPTATGTVGQCSTHTVHTSSTRHRSGSNRTETTCQMTWQAGGAAHAGSVDTGDVLPAGSTVVLRVHGNSASLDTPLWLGAASAGGGLLIAAAGIVLLVRTRRHT